MVLAQPYQIMLPESCGPPGKTGCGKHYYPPKRLCPLAMSCNNSTTNRKNITGRHRLHDATTVTNEALAHAVDCRLSNLDSEDGYTIPPTLMASSIHFKAICLGDVRSNSNPATTALPTSIDVVNFGLTTHVGSSLGNKVGWTRGWAHNVFPNAHYSSTMSLPHSTGVASLGNVGFKDLVTQRNTKIKLFHQSSSGTKSH